MKHLNIKTLTIYILSFALTFCAIYFHTGFFYFVNEVIYSDNKIPFEHKNDLYYFMEDKLLFKNISATLLLILSILFFLFNYRNNNKFTKGILTIQLVIVFFQF
ncbi:hypothetical protein SAMN05444377_10718 [Flavobacterium fontis]|uniref:Uncharacterized protein n=1 Tax=Flavobacterium fontis TaxID=1124188 RepID=A0A1M5AX46_9FLAO|nr:hypothetical protein SAMN05444377_10718 [Flavobacterium fontis]